MSYLRRIGTDCFNFFLNICLGVASRGMNKELARRDAERGRDTLRWFTPEEVVVAEALATVIVPSDDETPGIDEVDVLGPAAIVVLDNMVTASPPRQYLYSRGLLSFDAWAMKERGCKFAEMSREDQIMLFSAAQRGYEDWSASASPVVKAWRKLRAFAQARNGSLFAAKLYSQIRDDCFQVFYTSRVSWVWLDYDGPPMDKGYPSVVEHR
jgi:Gluconate 2-dehydrogenase subunit 3